MAQGLLNVDPLMYLGLGLLNSSGPSTQPRPIGAGLLQGVQMADQARMNQLMGQRLETQDRVLGAQLKQIENRQKAVDNFGTNLANVGQPGTTALPGMTPELAGLFRSMPAEEGLSLYQQVLAKSILPKDPVKVGAGERIVDPRTGREMYAAPEKAPEGMQWVNGQLQAIPGYAENKTGLASALAAAEANARLPAQASLAGYNAQLDINKAGPMEAARLSAINAPVLAQVPGAGQMTLPAGKVGEITAKAAEEQAKSSRGAGKVLDLLNTAEPIVAKATGSVAGAGLDKALSAFGISTQGANAVAQLKALEGALILNMPRLEGPQSNLDQQLYREAAGKIGDPMTPAAQKKAAIDTVRQIYAKYSGGASAQSAGNDPLGIRR